MVAKTASLDTRFSQFRPRYRVAQVADRRRNVSVAVWPQAGSNAHRRVQISRVAKMEIQVLALPTRIFGGHILRSTRLVVAVAVTVGSLTVTTV